MPLGGLGGKGSKSGIGRVKLSNIDTGRLKGLKYKLICHFKLAVDLDGPAFLKRELMRLGVDEYQ